MSTNCFTLYSIYLYNPSANWVATVIALIVSCKKRNGGFDNNFSLIFGLEMIAPTASIVWGINSLKSPILNLTTRRTRKAFRGVRRGENSNVCLLSLGLWTMSTFLSPYPFCSFFNSNRHRQSNHSTSSSMIVIVKVWNIKYGKNATKTGADSAVI